MISATCRRPTPEELGQAVRDGAPVYFGLPAHVPVEGGYAVLNLALAAQEHPDPWMIVAVRHSHIVDLASADDRTMYVHGMEVQEVGAVERGLELMAPDELRHSSAGEEARQKATEAVIRIEDAMVRARMLDIVDGWAHLSSVGQLLDEDERHGTLLQVPDLGHILVVTCPTTGRMYGHKVPPHKTAQAARLWIMHGIDPEVET